MSELKILSSVVCEDIRQENNGKQILIGVYNSVLVQQFPVVLSLAFWIQYLPTQTGKFKSGLRVVSGDTTFLDINADIEIPAIELSSFNIVGIPFALQTETTLKVELKQPSGQWEFVREFSVRRRPSAVPTPTTETAKS